MAPLQGLQAIVVPVRQVRGHRQELEVFGAERRFLIDPREDRTGVRPGAPVISLSAALELTLHPGAR